MELLVRTTHEYSQEIHERSQQIREIKDAAARLLHIAQIHEQRLKRLEGGEQ